MSLGPKIEKLELDWKLTKEDDVPFQITQPKEKPPAWKIGLKALPQWVLVNKFVKSDLGWGKKEGKTWEEAIHNKGEECAVSEANLITSEVAPGVHSVILDIDIQAKLIPSSTSGHGHLYIDKQLTWGQYSNLLTALADAGIISEGYKQASFARQATAVRVPWVKKNPGEWGSNPAVDAADLFPGEFILTPKETPSAATKEELKKIKEELNKAKAEAEAKNNKLQEWEKELLGTLDDVPPLPF